MGRPRIKEVQQRKWFKECIEQVDSDGEWDHLIWTGPGTCDKYHAPQVTSPGGNKNVRRVLWEQLHGERVPSSQEVVPQCDEDACVSPRHAALMDGSEAAYARYHTSRDMPTPRRDKPWLLAGTTGARWSDFTDPMGKSAAVLAYTIATQVHDLVDKAEMPRDVKFEDELICFDIWSLESPVRVRFQQNWAKGIYEDALLDILSSPYIDKSLTDSQVRRDRGLRVLFGEIGRINRNHGGHTDSSAARAFYIWDSDEGQFWLIKRPEESADNSLIKDPQAEVKSAGGKEKSARGRTHIPGGGR